MSNLYEYGAGRVTAKPLAYPDARKVSDIFDAAKLAQGMPNADSGWNYMCSTRGGSFCGHIDGVTSIIVRSGTAEFFCYSGAHNVFASTWVQAKPGIVDVMGASMIDRMESFETILRNDGRVLVTAKDCHSIGQRYVALLDAGENVETLFSAPCQERLAEHRAHRASVESCVSSTLVNLEMAKRLGVAVKGRA